MDLCALNFQGTPKHSVTAGAREEGCVTLMTLVMFTVIQLIPNEKF